MYFLHFPLELVSFYLHAWILLTSGQKITSDPRQAQQFVKEIESKLAKLAESWVELKKMSSARAERLDENLSYQQFLASVEEEESWNIEKQHLLGIFTYFHLDTFF